MIVGKADCERKHPSLDTGGWRRAQSQQALRLDRAVRDLLACFRWPMQTKHIQHYEPLALGETPKLSSYQDRRT